MDIDPPKKISILGTNNRYQVKKLLGKDRNEKRQNKVSQKWNIEKEELTHEKQLNVIKTLVQEYTTTGKLHDYKEHSSNEIYFVFIQQLKHKIANYKQQDILKKILDLDKFVSLRDVITCLHDGELKCFYCSGDIFVLYEIVREMNQWTLDRIDNTIGHNTGNVVISCLECNLKRKNMNKDSFFFTKNLHIIKNEPDVSFVS